MIASVLIEYNVSTLNKVFDYIIPSFLINKLKVGHKVYIPFNNRKVEGFVLDIKQMNNNADFEYKEIESIVDEDFCLNKELLDLGNYISKCTISNLISCYQAMLPKALKASYKTKINKKYLTYISLVDKEYVGNEKENKIINFLKTADDFKSKYSPYTVKKLIEKKVILEIKKEVNREVKGNIEDINVKLTELQKQAVFSIYNDSKNTKFLIKGVTASGKTEVYISLIRKYLSDGKTAIMLVPEISLTPQIVARFKGAFSDSVAVLHSRLSEGEKYDEYRKIIKGKVSVVVGARSAIFAPLKNIGIVIIDECQSSTYHQENNPRYDAIEVAFKRCEYHNAKCVLGSATPLLEQYARALKGVFKLIQLNQKVCGNLPTIQLIDMNDEVKKRNFILSEELKNKMHLTLKENKQVMLLLNRRGFSTFISCSACGYVHKCPNCDISLTYHKSSHSLSCHYCGYRATMSITCPQCKEDSMKDLGMGTEKLEEIVAKEFSGYRVLRMDADTTARKGNYEKIIDDFKSHQYDILIGTQMISKGLNFPDLSLVGIINADTSLNIPDFRSGEKTFELLSQTLGRTGRYEIPGYVIIQTYNPDNYVFRYIKDDNFELFYKYEMNIRKKLKYPPYYYLVALKISSVSYEIARNESNKIKKYLDKNFNDEFIILGPSIGRIFKIKNKYNFQIIIKYKNVSNLYDVLRKLNENYINNQCSVSIDINPVNVI